MSLNIAGDGPELERLQQQVASLNLGSTVTFSGWADDIVGFFSDADLFVLPSRDEPFGIVVLEAMACAVPMVVTTTQGPKSILDNTTATFIPANDVDALSSAIKDAIDNFAESRARATRAQELCRDRYSAAPVLSAYESLYAELNNAET